MTTSRDLGELADVDPRDALQAVRDFIGSGLVAVHDGRERALVNPDLLRQPDLRPVVFRQPDSDCYARCVLAHAANFATRANASQEESLPAGQVFLARPESVDSTRLTWDDPHAVATSKGLRVASENLAALIRPRLKHENKTEIAARLDVSLSVISRLLAHKERISFETIEKLADKLGEPLAEIFTPDLYDADGQKRTLATEVTPVTLPDRSGDTLRAQNKEPPRHANAALVSGSAKEVSDFETVQSQLQTARLAIADASIAFDRIHKQARSTPRPATGRGRVHRQSD